MRFVGLNSLVNKARRFVSGNSSVLAEEVKDADKLANILRGALQRVSDLEAKVPAQGTEFEVSCGASGALVSLPHNYGCPVRWWVTGWLQVSGVAYPVTSPNLAEDSSSDSNTLVLRSYTVGRAIVRVEPAQAGVEVGVVVVNGGGGGGGTPTGTGFYHTVGGVMDAAAKKVDLAATADVTGTLPFGNGGTGLTALGSAGQVIRTNAGVTAMEWTNPLAASGVVGRGTYASMPSAGTAGRIYIATDGPLSFYDDGANWQPIALAGNYTATPPVSGFTTIQAGGRSTTISDSKGGILMAMTNGAVANDYRLIVKSTPASSFTVTAHFTPMLLDANYSGAGICIRASSDGMCLFYGPVIVGNAIQLLTRRETASGTGGSPSFTFAADALTLLNHFELTFGNGLWLRLSDDTTTRTFSYSLDGQNFITAGTQTDAGSGMTAPNQAGMWVAQVNNAGSASSAIAFFDSFVMV